MDRPARRTFLLGSAAAVSGAGQSSASIRTALIGSGRRGGTLLAQVLECAEARVAAICDIDAEARDRGLSAAAADKPVSYDDYRRVLDQKEIDAVVIATPCDLHAGMAAAALDAGKHVYCEKPLAVTPEQVLLAVRAARRSKAVFQIGQQMRYIPALGECVRQLHEGGVLGPIFAIKAQRHSVNPYAPGQQPSWYGDVSRSGDLIVENAIHNIDIANWMAGSHPVMAFGHGKTYLPERLPPGRLPLDGYSVLYVSKNDVRLEFSQFKFHPSGVPAPPGGQWWTVFGEKGAATIRHREGVFYPRPSGEPVDLVPPELKEAEDDAMEQFFLAIREGRRPAADITVGATAALTAIMGRESIYQRRAVTWEEMGEAAELLG